MRDMIGCAGIVAVPAFLLGVIGSLFATQASLFERLVISLLPATFAFTAAMILFTRDHVRRTSVVRAVRKMLMARDDLHDSEFLACFPDVDSVLIAQIRVAIANFFDVPPQKIRANDSLHNDLRFRNFEPAIHSYVVCHVLNARNAELHQFTFNTTHLADFREFAQEIKRVLNDPESSQPSGNP